jgi:hypothetical protein
MAWQSGKSSNEFAVEQGLARVVRILPLTYSYNRAICFSGRLRYDFVIDCQLSPIELIDWSDKSGFRLDLFWPYLIEVHGEQHYQTPRCFDERLHQIKLNDAIKESLARQYRCPLLVIPHRQVWDSEA